MDKRDLKIVSFKVRGLNNDRKRTAIFKYIEKHDCNIAFLQETYSSEADERKWSNEWEGNCYYLHGSKHSKGLAIMIKKDIDIQILDEGKDAKGRFIYLNAKIDDNVLHLFNIYAPNKEIDQIAFINSLTHFIRSKELSLVDNCIFGGDWNLALDINLDKNGGMSVISKKNSHLKLMEFISTFELIDIWRKYNKTKRKFTWRQRNPFVQCRLDYFLVSQDLEVASKSNIMPSILSDHSPVSLEIRFLDTPKLGPGHWKLNISLLKENEYKEQLRSKLMEIHNIYNDIQNANLKWELYKYEIRKFSIQYSTARKKNQLDKKKNNYGKRTL